MIPKSISVIVANSIPSALQHVWLGKAKAKSYSAYTPSLNELPNSSFVVSLLSMSFKIFISYSVGVNRHPICCIQTIAAVIPRCVKQINTLHVRDDVHAAFDC